MVNEDATREQFAAERRRRDEHEATERAHRALRASPEYRARLQIASDHDRAASAASAVGMSLGAWAARGDWAGLTEEGRTRAGTRALSDLYTALGELAVIRTRLADVVGEHQDDERRDDALPDEGCG